MSKKEQNSLVNDNLMTELAALRTEMVFIHQELTTIRKFLQTQQEVQPEPASNPGRFAGMWSDFDEEDAVIFESILQERGHFFAERSFNSAE